MNIGVLHLDEISARPGVCTKMSNPRFNRAGTSLECPTPNVEVEFGSTLDIGSSTFDIAFDSRFEL